MACRINRQRQRLGRANPCLFARRVDAAERIVEQTERDLEREHAAHRLVQPGQRHLALFDQIGEIPEFLLFFHLEEQTAIVGCVPEKFPHCGKVSFPAEFADEPSAGLDPRARRGLINLLRELPLTMLVSTHDMLMVRELFPQTDPDRSAENN